MKVWIYHQHVWCPMLYLVTDLWHLLLEGRPAYLRLQAELFRWGLKDLVYQVWCLFLQYFLCHLHLLWYLCIHNHVFKYFVWVCLNSFLDLVFFGVAKNCFLSYLDFMNVDTLTRTTGFLWRVIILNGKFSGSVGNRRTRYCLFDNRFCQLIDECKPNNA